MKLSPEIPAFDLAAFDDDFFAAYEAELAEISLADQASQVLAGILKVEQTDGTEKSYQQLRDETRSFFANDWVRADEAIMNRMATEFAQACMAHAHGMELSGDEQLGAVFGRGRADEAGHAGHSHEDDDDDDIDPKTGKKRKKKFSWFGVLTS